MNKESKISQKDKAIEVRHHFIHELIANKENKLEYCGTKDQVADIFTKVLSIERFFKLRKMLVVGNV